MLQIIHFLQTTATPRMTRVAVKGTELHSHHKQQYNKQDLCSSVNTEISPTTYSTGLGCFHYIPFPSEMFCHVSTSLPCRVPTARSQAGPEGAGQSDQGHSCKCCNPTSSCQFHPNRFHQKRKTRASHSLRDYPPMLASFNCTKTIDLREKH